MNYVDTTKTINHVSLCAGYGGIDLGLKRAIPNLRTIAFSEIEAYACANLVAKMEQGLLDPAPIWSDLKTFPWAEFRGCVDILSGGYPCQPFSAAGKRLGKDDPRHLWPYIREGINAMRPAVCFFENVEGHITLGLSTVISDLEEDGYRCSWGIFSASEVGAPHQRKRVFILAKRKGIDGGRLPIRTQEAYTELGDGGGTILAHSCCNGYDWGRIQDGVERRESSILSQSQTGKPSCLWSETVGCSSSWPARPGQPQYSWEPPRVVGNTPSQRPCGGQENRPRQQSEVSREGLEAMGRPSQERTVALTSSVRWRGRSKDVGGNQGRPTSEVSLEGHSESRDIGNLQDEIKSSLGRDSYGSASGMGYGELCVTVESRVDELRLLGNGVVPQTCTKAFITLYSKLQQSESVHL